MKTSHKSDHQVKAILDQLKNYTIELSNKELREIRPEVLIIIGDDDEGMDFDEIARMKKYLTRSDIWILPNQCISRGT